MRLKSFAAFGFKSFADKIELNFDKGITAVVGPNGSGKSNISDAIRWALGEQSAKYLRGSKMEDVIFSGSSKRRALGVAEVNLQFDNSDHTLALDFEDVLITRRLYRSGESDYAINKKNCRLKDVIDLFADTGLGKGSMAIIGQNKIDEILNSRAEDRRGLFEEAAGIAKYRLRKKDAVKKLDDTAVNLTRISDIQSEVEAQVEPLARAAAKTEQFNKYNEELRLCQLSLLLRKLEKLGVVREELQKRKDESAAAFSEQAALLSSREAEAVAVQRELDRLAEAFGKLQEDIAAQEKFLEKLRGQQNVLAERAEQSARARTRLAQSKEKLLHQAEELESSMEKLAAEFDAADKERAQAALLLSRLESERDEQARSMSELQESANAAESEFFAGMQSLLKLRNEFRALEQEQEMRMRRREALKKNIDEAEAAQAAGEEQYKKILDDQARNGHELDLLQKNIARLAQAEQELQKNLAAIGARRSERERQLAHAETRAQTLRRMQENYEGFGFGIRALMKAQAPWRADFVGVVAELIKVDAEYVTALETALGEGAQDIITRSADSAKQGIAFLKKNGGGRATFLPLDTVQRRSPTKEEEAGAKMPGVRGFAIDLLSYDPEIGNALRFLLGRVLVAENIDAALAVAKATRYRLRVVTLDGDVVNAGGSMTGGARRQKEGYLAREAEIKQALAQCGKLRQEILRAQEEAEAQEKILQENSARLRAAKEKSQQQNLAAGTLRLRLEQLEEAKQRNSEHLYLLLDDRKQVTEEYLANRDRLKALRAAVSEQEGMDSAAKEKLASMKQAAANCASALTALENRMQDARIVLETCAAKSQLHNEHIRELDARTLNVRREIAGNEEEDARYQQTMDECAAQKSKLQTQSEEVLAQLAQIVGGKDAFAAERGKLFAQQEELEQKISAARKSSAAAEAALRQAELELARRESDQQHLLEQLEEDYQMDENAARQMDLGEAAAEDGKSLERRVNKLALAISELGPINAAAIEDYRAVKERSEFLQRQHEDLRAAKEKLEAVIGEINSGMGKRFREAFAEINKYFAQCYAKLFGGGTALLKLTELDNILESGIDIEAQPPGKKLQSLYLLSGGERALTVIALLFALLSYQPAPFCILDEIDAPLDDANIQRFANFLREYAAATQFIMITHRKGTMEAADIMYGVTMEESGVSKLLSVKINAREEV